MHGFTKKEKKEIDSRLRPQDGNVNKMKKKVIKERNQLWWFAYITEKSIHLSGV